MLERDHRLAAVPAVGERRVSQRQGLRPGLDRRDVQCPGAALPELPQRRPARPQRDVAPAELGAGLDVRTDQERLDEDWVRGQRDHVALNQVAGAGQHPVRSGRSERKLHSGRSSSGSISTGPIEVRPGRVASTRSTAGGRATVGSTAPATAWARPTRLTGAQRGRSAALSSQSVHSAPSCRVREILGVEVGRDGVRVRLSVLAGRERVQRGGELGRARHLAVADQPLQHAVGECVVSARRCLDGALDRLEDLPRRHISAVFDVGRVGPGSQALVGAAQGGAEIGGAVCGPGRTGGTGAQRPPGGRGEQGCGQSGGAAGHGVEHRVAGGGQQPAQHRAERAEQLTRGRQACGRVGPKICRQGRNPTAPQ